MQTFNLLPLYAGPKTESEVGERFDDGTSAQTESRFAGDGHCAAGYVRLQRWSIIETVLRYGA